MKRALLFLTIIFSILIAFTACKKEDDVGGSYLNILSITPEDGSTLEANSVMEVTCEYFISDEEYVEGTVYEFKCICTGSNGNSGVFGFEMEVDITSQTGTVSQTWDIGNLIGSTYYESPYEIEFRITNGINVVSDKLTYYD